MLTFGIWLAHGVAGSAIGKTVGAINVSESNAGHEQSGFDTGLLFDERIDSVLGRGHSVLRILEREVGRPPFLGGEILRTRGEYVRLWFM